MDGASTRPSSCSPLSPSRGGTEMGLQQLQLPLPWLDQGAKVVAADGDRDLGAAAAPAKTGKRRRSAVQGGVARGLKVFVRGLVEMVGKRLECSVPAAKFGHVAYIR